MIGIPQNLLTHCRIGLGPASNLSPYHKPAFKDKIKIHKFTEEITHSYKLNHLIPHLQKKNEKQALMNLTLAQTLC